MVSIEVDNTRGSSLRAPTSNSHSLKHIELCTATTNASFQADAHAEEHARMHARTHELLLSSSVVVSSATGAIAGREFTMNFKLKIISSKNEKHLRKSVRECLSAYAP